MIRIFCIILINFIIKAKFFYILCGYLSNDCCNLFKEIQIKLECFVMTKDNFFYLIEVDFTKLRLKFDTF
jgi:hypothetical protein